MTIYDLLKQLPLTSVRCGERWAVWSCGKWVVMEPGLGEPVVLLRTADEDAAVKKLEENDAD